MKTSTLTFGLRMTLVLIIFFSAFASEKIVAQQVGNVYSTALSSTRAHIYFTVDPAGAATTVRIQYSLQNNNFGAGMLTATIPTDYTGSTAIYSGYSLSGLAANSTYYYRVWVQNSSGSAYAPASGALSFTTLAAGVNTIAATVTNLSVFNITSNAAVAQYSLTAGNDLTLSGVKYTTDQNFVTGIQWIPSGEMIGNTGTAQAISLSGLSPNTTYYVQARAVNSVGEVFSTVTSFTTLSDVVSIPVLTDESVSAITNYSASIYFTVNPGNGNTQLSVIYGTDPNLITGNQTKTVGTYLSNTNTPLYTVIDGLLPNAQYYYKVLASNTAGSASTVPKSFTTVANRLITEYNFNGTMSNTSGGAAFPKPGTITYTTDRNLTANSAILINNAWTSASITGLPLKKESRSISLWIKPTVVNTDNIIFSYGMGSYDDIYGASFTPTIIYNFSYVTNVAYTTTVSANTWKHIVYTLDEATAMAKIYVDGALVKSGSQPNWYTSNSQFFLGSLLGASGSISGAIDDLKIYNYAVTDTEVASLFNNNSITTSVINPPKSEVNVKLYPSPVHDMLNIETALDIRSVDIYNMQGQKVLTSNQKQVNIAGLTAGVYVVKVQDIENKVATQKITTK